MPESRWTEIEAEEWSDAIVAAMKLGGVDNLFFVSGSELNFYQEACAKALAKGRPSPKLISLTHENTALNAAIGNAMIRNQPSATAVHVDAGTLHMGAAIHTAWRAKIPVLMTAGAAPRALTQSMRGARNSSIAYWQEPRDQGEIVRQYTKADAKLEHVDNPGLLVSRLLQIAMSEPQGPGYLTIAQETAMLPLPGHLSFPTRDQLGVASAAWADPDDVRAIAGWLAEARNPVIYAGGAGRDYAAVNEIVQLAEMFAIPVMVSGNGDRLSFPTTHWAYGTAGRVREADVVLVLEDVNPFVPGPNGPPDDAQIAWVSTDPVYSRYLSRDFRADRWIPASVTAFCSQLREIGGSLLTRTQMNQIQERRQRLEAKKAQVDQEQNDLALADLKAKRLTGRAAAYELGNLLDSEAIVMNDGLSSGGMVIQYAKRTKPGTYFRSGSSAGGWGGGASLGVKLARPDADVIHATGDGFFMFGNPLGPLYGASQHKAGYLTLVFVNNSYSTGTSSLNQSYPEGFAIAGGMNGGVFDPPPNFAKLAEAANGFGEEVRELDQLAPALKRGLEHSRDGLPAVIAVHVPPGGGGGG